MSDRIELRPVQLPWAVSASTPFLRLLHEEDSGSVSVECCADFGPRFDRGLAGALPSSSAPLVVAPPPIGLEPSPTQGTRYRWLRLTFVEPRGARVAEAETEDDVLPAREFDLGSLSDLLWVSGMGPISYNEKYLVQWEATGIAPDPGVYEGQGAGTGHVFIVVGDRSYVEVEAAQMTWEHLV